MAHPMQPSVAVTVAVPTNPDALRSAWMEGIVDAWARYLADLLSLRCSFFTRKGGVVRWCDEDPPTYDASAPQCQSCKVPLPPTERRVLCRNCRKCTPTVETGPTIADVMRRSSHMAYVLDDTKKAVIRTLRKHQELAYDAVALPRTLRDMCMDAHEELVRANGTGNVTFDRALVDVGGSYDQTLICGLYESPVHVGGMGVALKMDVTKLTIEWLTAIDERLRNWFGIPVSSEVIESASVKTHIEHFAMQIANRIAMLEPPEPSKANVLCVDFFEHCARVQYVSQLLVRDEQRRLDCQGMTLLGRLARHGIATAEDWSAYATLQRRQPLMETLRSPPPELLKELRSIVQHMRFAELRDVMGNANEAGRSATRAGVETWRKSINPEVLCLLLERAILQVGQWTQPAGYFIETITRLPPGTSEATRAQLRLDPEAILPPTPWARATGRWQFVPRERLTLLRTGLQPTSLRIVMLCSALTQLLGTRTDEPEVFAPGVVAYDLLNSVALRAEKEAESAFVSLRELMQPLMVGVECAVVKHQLQHWAGSHLEDDLRSAAQHVCRYSLQELTDVFDVDSSHWDGHGLQLVRKVNERLVFKMPGSGDNVVSQVLTFALPLLRRYRIAQLGWTPTMRSRVAGELLQFLPSVRQWIANGSEGPLLITRGEVYDTSDRTKRLLENLKASRMVRQIKMTNCDGSKKAVWRFEGPELLALVAPEDAPARRGSSAPLPVLVLRS